MKTVAWFKRHGGFTLVEVIVSMGLIAAVLGVFFTIFSNATASTKGVTDRVDTQSQMRMVMNEIQKQLRTATDVRIRYTTNDAAAGLNCYYIGNPDAENAKSLMVKVGTGTAVKAMTHVPIQGLQVTFIKDYLHANVVQVTLTCDEGYTLTSQCFTKNDDTVDGNYGWVIILKPVS